MSDRTRAWITWALIVISAIVVGVIRGQPIVIPLPPIKDQPPITDQPPQPPSVAPDPLNAIVRISRTGVGCSATLVYPRRADGRYWVLSAAHCTDRIGEKWTARFRDGRTTGLTVVNRNAAADYSWMVTDVDTQIFPSAILRENDPPVGTKIWHAGYGVHIPGNREDGEVTGAVNSDGQIKFALSVSSGDSGGGIMMDADGHLISAVCCTSGMARKASVWGTSPVAARKGQVMMADLDEWAPIPIPLRMDKDK